MAMQRTLLSPMCCATSSTSLMLWSCTSCSFAQKQKQQYTAVHDETLISTSCNAHCAAAHARQRELSHGKRAAALLHSGCCTIVPMRMSQSAACATVPLEPCSLLLCLLRAACCSFELCCICCCCCARHAPGTT
jgi:hypothetical protein